MNKLLILATILCFFASPCFSQDKPAGETSKETLVFIVNSEAPIWKDMNAKDIKNIFLGKIKNRDSIHILPTIRHNEDLKNEFLDQYIGLSANRFKSYWVKAVFSKGGERPKEFESLDELLNFIGEHTGAIGFARNSEIEELPDGVKTLTIQPE